ncbi:hypothetical protein TVAG_001660 [Trichomonas vaginalis G3]|uniref:Uncharacterized protein n=1 Tax=Trichomonas vaginalis (strain ATCC PRA-98 / G3) TaxID=412133 RepID=A2FSX4_TRIV3|nr:hypothetical protein TVAGG3_0315890 [Trichomonas vaginalis G3]EAX91996.1 hypothetical protein TVAG_001660 [Trichomonas vaginalis G3]KAI5528951.1 hypothetical protein TVAGG3_0315890 [Trichomonas vaginalis G3]|eukprot:XP_001304926.1 hypothetical protein [Trichomonas vaginalis G3]
MTLYMDSIWFQVDDSDEELEESGKYMGVFNQRPEQIAAWLPRPQTPFTIPHKFVPSAFMNKASIEERISRVDSEPEVISFKPHSQFRGTSVSVY